MADYLIPNGRIEAMFAAAARIDSVYPERKISAFLGQWLLHDLVEMEHTCSLPNSIQEALNSGDGVYRP